MILRDPKKDNIHEIFMDIMNKHFAYKKMGDIVELNQLLTRPLNIKL